MSDKKLAIKLSTLEAIGAAVRNKEGTTDLIPVNTLADRITALPSEEPILEELTATANGEYTPSGDGYSKVTVAVEAEDSALPIEVATEAEMTALLTSGEVGGVYKYTGTTGTYENGALYVLEVGLITFTIDGTEYQAESGMTWADWVKSEYNTNNYTTLLLNGVETVLIKSSGMTGYGLSYNDAFVPITDTIVADRAYVQKYGIHGGGGAD